MKKIRIAVGNCAGCPFVTAGEPDEPWYCDALGSADGHTEPRQLPEQRGSKERWPDPPDWCPLRTAPRVIRLRGTVTRP